jgi:hypothetical protein
VQTELKGDNPEDMKVFAMWVRLRVPFQHRTISRDWDSYIYERDDPCDERSSASIIKAALQGYYQGYFFRKPQ